MSEQDVNLQSFENGVYTAVLLWTGYSCYVPSRTRVVHIRGAPRGVFAGVLSAARTRGGCGRGQVAYRRLGHVGGRGRGQVAYRRLGHARGRGRGQVVYLDYWRLGDATT